MKEVFGKICVKRCLVQICKPPPGINPIKHEVPPGYFVSTLPHCTQCSTLHNFVLLYNNCKRLPRTRDGVDNGGTVHHLAINNSREMTASKDFKRLEHKNLRHFNFFYQDVICIGHQPSSLSDCCQCWYWGGLPDNFSRNYEIQATRAKVSLWLIWYLLEPWWGVMIHWVWALMTRVQYIVRSWVFRSSRIRSVWIFFCVQVVKFKNGRKCIS